MKSIKPSNQLRRLLKQAVSWRAYRFLCILMTALLFCGMNSQVMAAAIPPGANYDSNNPPPGSGDKFSSQSFLKASNPTTDDSKQWTWGEEIGAGILGAAIVGGAFVTGYKFYKSRQDSTSAIIEQENQERARSRSINGSEVDKEVGRVTTPSENASSWWQQAKEHSYAAGGKILMALTPSCLKKEAMFDSENPFIGDLSKYHQLAVKKRLADEKAKRTCAEAIVDIFTFKVPDPRTARQKHSAAMKAVGDQKMGNVLVSQGRGYSRYVTDLDDRETKIKNLNPKSPSFLDDIKEVLDPEILKEISSDKVEKYTNNDGEREKAFLYFITKNQDELHLDYLLFPSKTPGRLLCSLLFHSDTCIG